MSTPKRLAFDRAVVCRVVRRRTLARDVAQANEVETLALAHGRCHVDGHRTARHTAEVSPRLAVLAERDLHGLGRANLEDKEVGPGRVAETCAAEAKHEGAAVAETHRARRRLFVDDVVGRTESGARIGDGSSGRGASRLVGRDRLGEADAVRQRGRAPSSVVQAPQHVGSGRLVTRQPLDDCGLGQMRRNRRCSRGRGLASARRRQEHQGREYLVAQHRADDDTRWGETLWHGVRRLRAQSLTLAPKRSLSGT